MSWEAIVFLAAAALAAVAFDLVARLRREHRDSGDFWTNVLRWTVLVLPIPLLVSALLHLFPELWERGYHLLLDLTRNAFDLSQTMRYRLALGFPFAVWLALGALFLLRSPAERREARWLAGSVGLEGRSRLWVLLFTVPLTLILFLNHGALGGGPEAYPGAAWGTCAVVLLSLAGVAWSGSGNRRAPARRRPEAATAPVPRTPWPEALARQGIALEEVVTWTASPPPRPVRGAAAEEIVRRLERMGARHVAPELAEAVAELMGPIPAGRPERAARLVCAPDDCGQVEAVALATTLLQQRFQATTLVVTSGGAEELADRLRRWMADPDAVEALGPFTEEPRYARVWVAGAETLSDRLLPVLKESARIQHLGMVVWWNLESYTGVLAANLWAISRRLHRLIRMKGRHDVRTLALIRSAPHGSAQQDAFVRRLLPHPFPGDTVVQVEHRFPRPVRLYRLARQDGYFQRGGGGNIQDALRHPVLVASKVSAEANWATCLEVPREVARVSDFLQISAGDTNLAQKLVPDPVQAEARLCSFEASDALSLVESVSQSGRGVAGAGEAPSYVGFTPPQNPYVGHLLRQLSANGNGGGRFATSRRLVGARANPAIFLRHLLLALNEEPDTYSGLLKNFLWNEEVVRQTLDSLFHEGKLTREEVRFLDQGDRLRIDFMYSSRRLPGGEWRPLDTVGVDLVDVRDTTAGLDVSEGVRLRVDPERLTIQAYPHRVFLSGGRRFKVSEWTSPEEVRKRGWVECQPEGRFCRSFRIRNNFVFDVRAHGVPAGIGHQGRLLTRQRVDLCYEEEVLGAIHQTPDLTTGSHPPPRTLRIPAVTQSFATRGLVLRYPEAPEPIALTSLAQALRHVLPVHLGVEEDALEVVPLFGDEIDGLETHGVAIVDLYPGGIGLIDAFYDEDDLTLHLLQWTREWLESCPCRSDVGCAECLRSPAALATNSDHPPLRSAALSVLGQIA